MSSSVTSASSSSTSSIDKIAPAAPSLDAIGEYDSYGDLVSAKDALTSALFEGNIEMIRKFAPLYEEKGEARGEFLLQAATSSDIPDSIRVEIWNLLMSCWPDGMAVHGLEVAQELAANPMNPLTQRLIEEYIAIAQQPPIGSRDLAIHTIQDMTHRATDPRITEFLTRQLVELKHARFPR